MFGMILRLGLGVDGWLDINLGLVFGLSLGGPVPGVGGGPVPGVGGGRLGVGRGVSRLDTGGGGFWLWAAGGNEGGGHEGAEEREELHLGDDIRVVDGMSEIESLTGVNKRMK